MPGAPPGFEQERQRDPYAIPKREDSTRRRQSRVLLSQDPLIRVMMDERIDANYRSMSQGNIHMLTPTQQQQQRRLSAAQLVKEGGGGNNQVRGPKRATFDDLVLSSLSVPLPPSNYLASRSPATAVGSPAASAPSAPAWCRGGTSTSSRASASSTCPAPASGGKSSSSRCRWSSSPR